MEPRTRWRMPLPGVSVVAFVRHAGGSHRNCLNAPRALSGLTKGGTVVIRILRVRSGAGGNTLLRQAQGVPSRQCPFSRTPLEPAG